MADERYLPDAVRRIALRLDYANRMRAHPRLSAAAGLALLGTRSALRDLGWFRSFAERRPVDAAGRPLPWFTYPAIALLTPRLAPSLRVFEYGAGGSTLWWSERVAAVWAVEHEPAWVAELAPRLPPHARVVLQKLDDGDAYPRAAADQVSAARAGVARAGAARAGADASLFDIVVIDGRRRNDCVASALEALAPAGVVIWDNSERPRYASGQQRLADAGFRRIDLHGMGPVNPWPWCTTIFYRDGNVLGL